MKIHDIENDFDEQVLQAEVPVAVEFWAPWCGYCRRLAPAVERLAGALGDKVRIVKVNVDDYGPIGERYEVDTFPTLVLFRNGEMVGSIVNPASQDDMEAWLEENGAL